MMNSRNHFLNAVMYSRPESDFMLKYLDFEYEEYSNNFSISPRVGLKGYLGCWTTKMAYVNVSLSRPSRTWLLKEVRTTDPRNKTLDKKFDSIPKQIGSGCCCNIVVFDENTYQIPFFSRILGSRSMALPNLVQIVSEKFLFSI